MKETLKTIEKALKEIDDYSEKLEYAAVINQIDLDNETVTFRMRKSEIIGEDKYGYTKRCYERKCKYRYSTDTYVIGSEDVQDCIFNNSGYQVGGVFMF